METPFNINGAIAILESRRWWDGIVLESIA
jgi:hypothetical protein